MQIFAATWRGALRLAGYMDPDDVTVVRFYWGAPAFAAATVYRLGDIVRPTTDNGYYYECTIPGLSGGSEPATWGQTEQVSGTATFEAYNYDLFVRPGETLQTSGEIAASAWVATDGVTLSNAANDAMVTSVQVSAIPENVTSFVLTNRVRKNNGEQRDRSVVITVNEQ